MEHYSETLFYKENCGVAFRYMYDLWENIFLLLTTMTSKDLFYKI